MTATRTDRADRRLVVSLRHAMHLVVFVLLVAAVAHTHLTGGGPVHGLGRTTAATVVALVFGGLYAAGMMTGRSRSVALDPSPRVGPGTALWLGGLALTWAAGLLVSGGFVWVALPVYLLVLALVPTRTSAAVVLGLVAVAALLTWLHDRSAGVALSPDSWLNTLVTACVAVCGYAVFVQLRRDARDQRALVTELREAHDSLAVTERANGVMAERERLAREIHDTLGQGLASIVVLSRTAAAGDGSALALIESTARENLAETRRVVRGLGSPGEVSLEEALRVIAHDAERLSGATGTPLAVTVAVDGRPPAHLPEAVVTALCRGVQASLANVVQHARASRCAVNLGWFEDRVVVDVVDDGQGFDPRAVDGRAHFGLQGLRARMADVGGSLALDAEPGRGTTVALTVPLAPEEPR